MLNVKGILAIQETTRMHSSRMRTGRSLTDRISWYQAGGGACVACTHQPCKPPHHTCPQPCTPPAMHAPPRKHACPHPRKHTCPPRKHAHPPEARMPPRKHACPPGSTHAPPGSTHYSPPEACMPPLCGQTDTCKNITFANFVCGR